MDDKPTFQIKVDKKNSTQKAGSVKHKTGTNQQKAGSQKTASSTRKAASSNKNKGGSQDSTKRSGGASDRVEFKTTVRKVSQDIKKSAGAAQGNLNPQPVKDAVKDLKQAAEKTVDRVKNDQTVKDATQTVSEVAEQASTTAQNVAAEVKQGVGSALSQAQSFIESEVDTSAGHELFSQLKESSLTYYQSHRRQVLYGAIGFVIALGILLIGLPKVILISLLTFIGVAIGQYVDGKPYIVRFFTDFIKRQ